MTPFFGIIPTSRTNIAFGILILLIFLDFKIHRGVGRVDEKILELDGHT